MWVSVAKAEEILDGHHRIMQVQGNHLALFKRNGTFFAVQNACPHRGGPVCEGDCEGHIITCPWHGLQFNLATGHCLSDPTTKLQTYDVVVENGEIKVNI